MLCGNQNVEVTEVSHKVHQCKQRAVDRIVGGTGLWLQKGLLVEYLQIHAEQDPEMEV